MACLSTLTIISAWAYDIEAGGLGYNRLADGTLAVAACQDRATDYMWIPDSVKDGAGYPRVTAIADHAFDHCEKLTEVRLPRHLRHIGASAFALCSSLQSIELPDGVETIGDIAFYGCSQVAAVAIPASVTHIGAEAFGRCLVLNRFTVDAANQHFCAIDGVLFSHDRTLLVAFPNASHARYQVPAGTLEIGRSAFSHCQWLSSLSLPASLTTIGEAAFYGCTQLQQAEIPDGVSHVGLWAFAECRQLRSARVGAGVSELGDGAFSFCDSLQQILVDTRNSTYRSQDGVVLTADGRIVVAVPGRLGPSYQIPATVDSIRPQAFYGCSRLQTLSLPASLASIGSNPFIFCDSLSAISVDHANSGYSSADGVLYDKQQRKLVYFPNAKPGAYTLPQGITAISHGPFMGSHALHSLTIPKSVTAIGDWALLGCYGLQSVSLPHTLTSLGQQAFADCASLETIICSGDPIPTADDFTSLQQSRATLYVPMGSLGSFRSAQGWGGFEHMAEYGLFANSLTASRGRQLRVPIRMSHALPISSIQADIVLPQGIDMVPDAEGGYLVALADDHASTHLITCAKKADGLYSVAIFSPSGRQLTGADTVFYVTLRTVGDTPVGTYDLQLRDVTLSFSTDVHEGETPQRDLTAAVDLQSLLGDVNRNGLLNVADIVEANRYVLGIPTARFHFDEADVNLNGTVNFTDSRAIADIICRDTLVSVVTSEGLWQEPDTDGERLSADHAILRQGSDASIDIRLDNRSQSLTAHQFELRLPAGLSLARNSEGHYLCQPSLRYGDIHQVVSVSERSEGDTATIYTIVAMSMGNEPITQQSGTLLSLTLHADDSAATGLHQARLSRIVFADTEGYGYTLPEERFGITVSEGSGIDGLKADETLRPQNIYNLQGQTVRRGATSLRSLPAGIYIIGGRKVMAR